MKLQDTILDVPSASCSGQRLNQVPVSPASTTGRCNTITTSEVRCTAGMQLDGIEKPIALAEFTSDALPIWQPQVAAGGSHPQAVREIQHGPWEAHLDTSLAGTESISRARSSAGPKPR